MEQQINIAALLKDCPKGTKLYSPICGECELEKIIDGIIYTDNNYGNRFSYNSYGLYRNGGECLLFPSKENRDWSTFKKPEEEQPKFKVGDVVKDDCDQLFAIVKSLSNEEHCESKLDILFVTGNLIFTLATPEEIDLWNKETLHPNHLHYSKSKRKIIPWFLPFDRVVERCKDEDMEGLWSAGFFSHYDEEDSPCYPYHTVAGRCNECLPYNENTAKLIGTTDNYEEEE